jgi:dTDP-4-dehydrorhamnose 3,5-epimerase
MKAYAAAIPDILILEPDVFRDERGWFFESYNQRALASLGIHAAFVQDNHSQSVRHVVRGLHYEIGEPQGKLIRVVSGEVRDVAVDIRPGSATFGRHVTIPLSAGEPRMVWIPPGFAHGFAVHSDVAEVTYKSTTFYEPERQRIILWCDPALGIDWGLTGDAILSPRDRTALPLAEAELS